MPEGESFWNPYRWVTISGEDVERDVPRYHHNLHGLSGRLWCELEALTPLLIGDGSRDPGFVRHRNGPPYIPATSLKGAIRSLAEVVGNAAVPFRNARVDDGHQLVNARRDSQLDMSARTFGYLDGNHVFAGLIRFSNAELIGEWSPQIRWPQYEVAVGQPKPAHAVFYPGTNRRKFYHHHPGAKELASPHSGITQTTKVTPAPPGTRFRFTVDFENLRDNELDLLLYCLVLEEEATVDLSPAALGCDEEQGGRMLTGPLRHKLGGAKPHGAGSVHITVTKQKIWVDPAARYRGNVAEVSVQGGEDLEQELASRTAPYRSRTDTTMRELRAMLIYDTNDPRKPVHYPTFRWFQKNSQRRLKPTI